MRNSFIFAFVFFFVMVIPACSYGKILNVRTQRDFDFLSEQLISAIKTGGKDNEILVRLSSGVYVAKERQIILGWIQAPNKRIRIVGKNTIIIPDGKEYYSSDKYQGVFSYDNSLMCENRDIPIWTRCHEAVGLVEVLNAKTKECRIKTEEGLSLQSDNTNAYILIPEWCQTGVYKITNIKDGFIYFIADNLKVSYNNGYVVNDDYNYGGNSIRYKLCNICKKDDLFRIENGTVCLPKGVKMVREGSICNYITIQSSSFKSVEISGIEFRGNRYVDSKPAIFVCDTKCESIKIHDCKFIGMHGTVISVESTNNVNVTKNQFSDCHYNGVYSDNRCKGTTITSNTFTNMGKRMGCSLCIICKGEDYYVADNKLMDFGYGGIGVGVWHDHKQYRPSKGVVEKNELFYKDYYLSNVKDFCIMDGGAIYIWTINDDAVIRNNFIHNISGVKDNRGIFCDDGARNIKIYGNIITNIHNSYCIDSRRVTSVEKTVGASNINNEIFGNIVDGRIRFQGNEAKDNGCVFGKNYLLVKTDQPAPKNIYSNVVKEEDVFVDYRGYEKGRVIISKQSYQVLKKTKGWKSVKCYILGKNN